ncbi:MAG: Glutamine synthetase type I [uncultured Thermomicrobiales bacterium]|uniref:Glutamine synthetase type I n=1 Tax=uncultured Thermomicrobiales bacterium TaxID=1645740 RepID=A0A6J4ULP2_9BACT|nr:MAG: Glutamine synthetase type I [uncultured Thermomicrobiales bacterium]
MATTVSHEKITGKSPSKGDILAQVQEHGIKFINLQFTDVMGIVKSVTIPASVFGHIIDGGQWIDGSSIAGFTRIAESDMYLDPDLSTFSVVPWERDQFPTARVICWVYSPNGDPFPGDPRGVLLRQLERLYEMGYLYKVGPELEFFLFSKNGSEIAPLPHDRGGYFDLSTDLASIVRKDMVMALDEMGIEVEASHHEVAIGQHEIDFEYGDAVATADRALTFKYVLKAIAQNHGLHATFMPKPLEGINGSGMHCHQSFVPVKGGGNAFVDTDDAYGLSKIAKHFIAGQLAHARGLCGVIAPLVNSYRRLVPGFEAPVYVSWARTNRSALIRVPAIRGGNTAATRIELRCPDPSCNPYLAFAAMLAAGMDGIENELPLPEPVEENLYHFTDEDLKRRNIPVLPATLGEAVAEMEKDEVIRAALGDHVFERLTEAQLAEWSEFRRHVSSWERDRYLEVY